MHLINISKIIRKNKKGVILRIKLIHNQNFLSFFLIHNFKIKNRIFNKNNVLIFLCCKIAKNAIFIMNNQVSKMISYI